MLHWRPSFLLFKYISISELPYLCTFQTQLYSKWSNRCRNHWYRFAEAFNQASNVFSYYFFQILKNSFEFLNIFSFRSFKFNCVRNDLSSQSFSVSLASLCRSFQPKFVSVSVFQILNFLQFAKTFLLSISGITWAHHDIRTNFEFSSIWKMVEKRGNLGIVNLGGIASNFQNSCATKMAKLSYDSSRCIGSYQVWSSRIMAESREKASLLHRKINWRPSCGEKLSADQCDPTDDRFPSNEEKNGGDEKSWLLFGIESKFSLSLVEI